MRNTKLIIAMLVGCTVLSGAAFAQDAAPAPAAAGHHAAAHQQAKAGHKKAHHKKATKPAKAATK